jgi:hypothetical protein
MTLGATADFDRFDEALDWYRARVTMTAEEAKAIAALHATEARYRDKANDADETYQAGLADARSAADRFIASRRVRGQAAACPSSGAVASATGGNTGVPADVPGADAMEEAIVRRGDDWQTFGTACHNWAMTLEK